MKIEHLDLADIKPYWRNARKNDDVEELKKSIVKFGFKVPLVVDENHTIITGHARFKALNQLRGSLAMDIGLLDNQISNAEKEREKKRLTALKDNLIMINDGKVPVVIADDLTEEKVKEYRISDNKLSELSTWDFDKLQFEIKEIGSVVGFTSEELSVMIRKSEVDFKNYSQEEIDKVNIDLTKRFTDITNNYDEGLLHISCPHCRETFNVKKSDIM